MPDRLDHRDNCVEEELRDGEGRLHPAGRAGRRAHRVHQANRLAAENVVLTGAATLASKDESAGDIANVDEVETALDEDGYEPAGRVGEDGIDAREGASL